MSTENLDRLLKNYQGKLAHAQTVSQGIGLVRDCVAGVGENAAEELYLLFRQHPDLTQAEITGNIADRLVSLVDGVTATFVQVGEPAETLLAEPLRQAVTDAFLERMQALFAGASSVEGGVA